MKVQFKKDLRNFKNLENYLVVGFGLRERNKWFYLIVDDNFTIGCALPKNFDIVDTTAEGYTRRDDLNFGKEFYLENNMNNVRKDLRSYLNINNPYENINYFTDTEYPVSDEYKKSMLHEENKLSRIEGTLLFTDHYLYEQFWDEKYREGLQFYKSNSLDYLLESRLKEPVAVNGADYEDQLLKFIEKAFGVNDKPSEKSGSYARILSGLINALFVKEVASVQRLESFYEDCFIIEYENSHYILSRYWMS